MNSYKQGVVNTEEHPVLRKTQIVSIIAEEGDFFIVKPYIASIEQKISKKDLIVN
jgi:hypothetical protein